VRWLSSLAAIVRVRSSAVLSHRLEMSGISPRLIGASPPVPGRRSALPKPVRCKSPSRPIEDNDFAPAVMGQLAVAVGFARAVVFAQRRCGWPQRSRR